MAKETESPPVWRFRFYAAGLSILFGIVGVVMLLPMARGVVSWSALPGGVLLIAGGALGVGAQRSPDVATSRQRGVLAALCTVVGLIEVTALLALT
jgi:hypothetical protein